jgi:hypothetical protein
MNGVNEYFKNLARQAGTLLSLPWQWIYAQWGHETGGFTSYLAKTQHNYAGLTNTAGDYRAYASDQDFVNSYANDFLAKMPAATSATSLEGFASGLRQEGYYTDSVSNYLAGLQRFLPAGDAAQAQPTNTYWRPAEVPADAPAPSEPYWKRVLYYNKLILTGKFQAAQAYKGTWEVGYTDTATGQPGTTTEGAIGQEATAKVEAGNKWIGDKIQTGFLVVAGLVLGTLGVVLLARIEPEAIKEG